MEAFMLDKEFLRKLDASPRREVYARITSLTFDEQPIECIEGRITGGSVNIDGASSVRRTCSLSLVTEKLNINDYIWGIRTKFHLEVGLKNEIDDNYPEICWFNLGYYVTTSFTSSINTNSRTISIQGKDKMCLLNGDLGGSLPSIIDFGREEWYDYDYEKVLVDEAIFEEALGQSDYTNNPFYIMATNSETQEKEPHDIPASEIDNWQAYEKQTLYKKLATYTLIALDKKTYKASTYYIKQENKQTKEQEYVLAEGSFDEKETYYKKEIKTNYHIKPLLIKKIIKEGVHAWGGEAYHNIIINDLDTYGMEQLTYRDNAATDDDENTDEKPLYIIKNLDDDTFQVTLDGKMQVYTSEGQSKLQDLSITNGFIFDTGIIDATKVSFVSSKGPFNRTVLRVNNAEDAGYRITDLTYVPEDGLTSSVGESFTSILDKIKKLLDDFEYFYNLDGQFVFQRKKTYANVNFSAVHNIDLENLYVDAAALAEPVAYDFSNNFLISAININPTLTNVKNDYAIQGKRTTASGAEVPIHLRYAIDKKPVYYKAIDGTVYVTNEYYNKEYNDKIKVVRDFLITPRQGGEPEEISVLRQRYWDYIIANMPRSSKDPNDLFFWSKHRSSNDSPYEDYTFFNDKWLGVYFKGKDKISYTRNDEEFDIQYTPGWWDLDAWADFYYLVTGQIPTDSLVSYSGFREKNKAKASQRLNQISTSSTNNQYIEYINANELFSDELKSGRDNSQRIFLACDAFEYIDTVIHSTEESAGLLLLGQTQVQDKCSIYRTSLNNNQDEEWFTWKKRAGVRWNNYQKNRYYIKTQSNPDKFKLCDEEAYDENKEYYERIYKPSNTRTTTITDEYYTIADSTTFGNAAASGLTCVEAVSQFVDNGITVEYILSPYEHWGEHWEAKKYYYKARDGSNRFILDESNVPSESAKPYYEKLETPETCIFPCWIYNPQFPEGSFRQAFEKGFRNWLSKDYWITFNKSVLVVDWREIIYQMSKDYLKYAMSDTIVTQAEFARIGDGTWKPYGPGQTVINIPLNERLTWRDVFTTAIMKNNPEYYWTGVTGYEQYYTDLNAFWRQLYNPNLGETISTVDDPDPETAGKIIRSFISDYFISNEDLQWLKDQNPGTSSVTCDFRKLKCSDDLAGWNSNLYFNPTALDFWFDFLDEGEVAQNYGVKVIGLRTKAVNNDKVSAVYFTKLPTICFYTTADSENWKKKTDEQVMRQSGYTFALLPPGLENNFYISSRQLSAKDYLDALLYQFSYVPEQLSITALPIYYLEPNTRIYVHDEETAIDGEYIVNKITLPLTYNGTMSISANKAPERII